MHLLSWRRNQFSVTVASFIGFTGFTLVMPFLPLYFRQLGVTDIGEIAFWSGLSLGATPALTALLAPVWGRLADRFGKKIMVERSLLSFVIVMAAMAYVERAWHVLALRTIQGFFAGYGALTLTMAAESAPRERMASAIGTVQMAQRLGPALGPVIGGVVAQLVGLRRAFLVAASFYALAFVLVLFMYHEPPGARSARREAGEERVTFRNVLAFRNFLLLMGVVFGIQFVDRSFGPILPLYVVQIGVSFGRAALVSGILFSGAAGAGALGNYWCDRLLRAYAARAVIAYSATLGAVAATLFAVASNIWLASVATVCFGLAVGVAMTAAYTAAGSVIPAGAHGVGFGLLTSASLTGLALSPIVSGFLAATSIRAVFVLDAITLVVLAALVSRVMVGALPKAQTPIVEET